MVDHLMSFSMDSSKDNTPFFGLQDVLGGIVFTNEFVNNTFPKDIKVKEASMGFFSAVDALLEFVEAKTT